MMHRTIQTGQKNLHKPQSFFSNQNFMIINLDDCVVYWIIKNQPFVSKRM